ncbi:hypothetical protein, partial [Melaminivora jejuensis]
QTRGLGLDLLGAGHGAMHLDAIALRKNPHCYSKDSYLRLPGMGCSAKSPRKRPLRQSLEWRPRKTLLGARSHPLPAARAC